MRKKKDGGFKGIWWVAGVAVVLALIMIGVSLRSAPEPVVHVKTDAEFGAVGNTWGRETARVTLVEFGDYQ